MPTYVLKPDRDIDRYILWSTVVENWTYSGDREEVLEHLNLREPKGYTADPGNSPADRIDRADKTGSSAKWPTHDDPWGGWNDTGFIVEQRGILARSDLAKFVDTWVENQDNAYALLRPFDDEETT